MNKEVKHYVSLARAYLRSLHENINPLIASSSLDVDDERISVYSSLAFSCNMTTDSVFILLSEIRVWDAEILMRSVTEGTVKYIYLLLGSDDELRERFDEYHRQVVVSNAQEFDNSCEHLKSLVDKYSRNDEQDPLRLIIGELESLSRPTFEAVKKLYDKWKFPNLLKGLLQTNMTWVKPLEVTLFNYKMSNHLIHKDDLGCGTVTERMSRNISDQRIADNAHAARILSDLCMMSEMRYCALLKFLGGDEMAVFEQRDKYFDLYVFFAKSEKEFAKSL